MSRLQEIQEQFKQKGIEYWDKFKETELYQKLDDKYESLSPRGQKITRYASAIVVILILVSYPLSQLETSKTLIAEFETKRQLIRDLFKINRDSSTKITLPLPPSDLTSQVRSTLMSAQLLPEQIIAVSPIEPDGNLIPRHLVGSAVAVQLSKLNIRQTVDIGTQLANISGSVKVKDLLMSASSDKAGYFDVTYKLYSLNVPQPIVESVEPEPTVRGRNNRDDNETTE